MNVALRFGALILMSAFLPVLSSAQLAITGGIGGVHIADRGTAWAYTGGLAFTSRSLRLTLLPLDASELPPEKHGRYRRQSLTRGQQFCVDTLTHEISNASLCGSRMLFAGDAELSMIRPLAGSRSLAVGVGGRTGTAAGAYAVASLTFALGGVRHVQLRGRGGSRFYEIALAGSKTIGFVPRGRAEPSGSR
jgi:hypothetical protein